MYMYVCTTSVHVHHGSFNFIFVELHVLVGLNHRNYWYHVVICV